MEFVESIINSIDKGEKVIGIFLDLSRAFDTVDHSTLINTLSSLGVKGTELAWFKSYISDRKQFVEISHYFNNSKPIYKETYSSSLLNIQYGVPQGSILGPLLFLCYLKGLPGVIWDKNNKICLYADDTNIIVTANSKENLEIASHINLSMIKDFFDSKNLLLNSQKSNFVTFTTKQTKQKLNPTIFIEENLIDQLEKTTFLGLVIDENLTWNDHVNLVVKKTTSGLYALRKMATSCNIETLKTIYFALIHSHVSYGICIYGSTSKLNMDRILLQQKRALTVILNLKKKSDVVKNDFSKLKIFTVYSLFIFETIKFVVSNNKLTFGNTVHSYNTRPHRLVEHHKLELFKKKITYKGNKYFDLLPQNIKKEINNTNRFLNLAKAFLIQSAFFSIGEFCS